jgi:hypothetical protein
MKAVVIAILGIVLAPPLALGADGSTPSPDAGATVNGGAKSAADRSQPGVNLVAFIGRKIEAKYVERKPKPNESLLDAEYFLRYEVLEVVFGSYPHKEITFSSYVHMGEPEFKKHKFGLVYVSEYDGRFVQQKYLFQAVYPTANGRWASCGDPYAGMADIHRHGVAPEPIIFRPPVAFDTARLSKAEAERKYPAPLFRHERGKAICAMGNFPGELFRVMKEGILWGRGVFRPLVRPQSGTVEQAVEAAGPAAVKP